MAFPASDVRFLNGTCCLIAIGRHLDAFLKCSTNRPTHLCTKLHVITCIRPENSRNWTGFAQIRRPGLVGQFEKLAFFHVSSAEVITVEITTFESSWCFHKDLLFFC